MKSKNYCPLHRHYMLIDKSTKNPFKIVLYQKPYILVTNKKYFEEPKKEFFSLKEKLYALNLPYNVAWCPISPIGFIYRVIFHNVISPSMLQLNINKGKVTPYISKKGGF